MGWLSDSLKSLVQRRGFEIPVFCGFLERLHYLQIFSRWTADHAEIPEFSRREELYHLIKDKECDDQPIDYLEFGVYQGASMQVWLQLQGHAGSRFFGFDTFEGLPEQWGSDCPPGTFSTQGQLPKIEDPRTHFIKGLFSETLLPFLRDYQRQSQIILHMDADLYSSTLYVLSQFSGLLQPGDIVIFDEFSALRSEFRAFVNFNEAFQLKLKPLGCTPRYTQVAFRIEASS